MILTARGFYNTIGLIERRRLQLSTLEQLKRTLDSREFCFDEELKSPPIPESVLSHSIQQSEDGFNTILVSVHLYLCYAHLLLKQPKTVLNSSRMALPQIHTFVLMLCSKSSKFPRASEKDKFMFSMYKAEALNMLGSVKQSLSTIKELPVASKSDAQFECTFGYSSPWVDSSIQYNQKTIQLFNSTALALQDEQESNSKETLDNLRKLCEQTEPDLQSQTTPLATLIVYNLLRRGQTNQALHYLKRRKLPDLSAGAAKATTQ